MAKYPHMIRHAGLLAWAMVGGWLFSSEDKVAGDGMRQPASVWLISHLAFGLVYWFASGRSPRNATSHLCALALVVCSLGVSYYSESGLGGILIMITASLLPWLMTARAAALWIVMANLTVAVVLVFPPINMSAQSAAMQLLIHAGFSAFMLAGSWVAMEHTHARQTQDRLGAELLATRALLDQSALTSERTRISRDVHDLLGHHLTALILNLDVAGRLASGRAKDHVDQSQTLARLLLSDVRDVVATLREPGSTGLREAIQQILDTHPDVTSVLDFRIPIELDDDGSTVILWCVREVLALCVANTDIKEIQVASWREVGATKVVIRSDATEVSRLLSDGHLRDVESLYLQHGGTICRDPESSGLMLCVTATNASPPRALPQGS